MADYTPLEHSVSSWKAASHILETPHPPTLSLIQHVDMKRLLPSRSEKLEAREKISTFPTSDTGEQGVRGDTARRAHPRCTQSLLAAQHCRMSII